MNDNNNGNRFPRVLASFKVCCLPRHDLQRRQTTLPPLLRTHRHIICTNWNFNRIQYVKYYFSTSLWRRFKSLDSIRASLHITNAIANTHSYTHKPFTLRVIYWREWNKQLSWSGGVRGRRDVICSASVSGEYHYYCYCYTQWYICMMMTAMNAKMEWME